MKLKSLARGKGMSRIQNIIIFALILIMAFMSYGTYFSISFEIDDELEADINEALYEITGDDDIKISDSVDIGPMLFVNVASSIADIIEAIENVNNDSEDPIEDEDDKKKKKADQELIDLVLFAMVFSHNMTEVVDSIEDGRVNGEAFRNALLDVIAILMLFVIMVVFSIVLTVSVIISIFVFAFGFKNPGRTSYRLSKAINRVISFLPLFIFVFLMAPSITIGDGLKNIMLVAIGAYVIGFVASRLKKYEGDDFKFLNFLHIFSFTSLAGCIMFVCFFIKSGMLAETFKATLSRSFLEELFDGTVDIIPIVVLVGAIVAFSLALCSIKRVPSRFACMSKSKRGAHIVKAVFALFAAIVPALMLYFPGSEFTLESDQMMAFLLYSAGLIIMLVSEILLASFSKKCTLCDKDRRAEIIRGSYVYDFNA